MWWQDYFWGLAEFMGAGEETVPGSRGRDGYSWAAFGEALRPGGGGGVGARREGQAGGEGAGGVLAEGESAGVDGLDVEVGTGLGQGKGKNEQDYCDCSCYLSYFPRHWAGFKLMIK